ncbi:MAG TPA: BatD family protein, partial [Puia sp.]|nr:BatD family protein [Puia sp.]
IEAFDPTAKDDINKTVAPMSGSKSFDYVFTPRVAGHYTIPSISFPYFDPSSQSYKIAGTEPLDIQVAPSLLKRKDSSGLAAASSTAPAAGSLVNRTKAFVQRHLEWIFTVIILSLIAIYLWRQNLHLKKSGQEQKEQKPSAEPAGQEGGVKTRPAQGSTPDQESYAARSDISGIVPSSYLPASVIADPLQEARLLFDNGDFKGFYREVNRAIWKALSKKLDLPASQLNKVNITRQLQVRGWDAPYILSLEHILNECEMNLYTPAYDTYNMQQLLRQAEGMLDKLA